MSKFYYKMEFLEDGGSKTTVKREEISLKEEILGIIFGVHVAGIRSIERCNPSETFIKLAI